MDITRRQVKVSEILEAYNDKGDDGVMGLGGRLDIRPPYQRNFIYDLKDELAVIDSVTNGFPLGIMYWVDKGNDQYEILDGQQRTMSITRFIEHKFHIQDANGVKKVYSGLTEDEKKQILDYELDVYVCNGSESDKLAWFKRINIVGKPLFNQELLNASYTGPWLSDAKYHFSRSDGPVKDFSKYLSGALIRQEYLETAIEWASYHDYKKVDVERYMADHQNDDNAQDLWDKFLRVMSWVKMIFPNYRNIMKGINWGMLFTDYAQESMSMNPSAIEIEIAALIQDKEVENNKGIYYYIFDGIESHLNLRTFDDEDKLSAYERQKGLCANPSCPQGKDHKFDLSEMEADHITPWSQGGKTTIDNLQLLCRDCNRRKGAS